MHRFGRFLSSRISLLWFLTEVTVVITSTAVNADDYDALLSKATAQEQVSVIVTGWQPITGTSTFSGSADSYQAVTGESELVLDSIRAKRGQVTEVRQFKYIPALVMSADLAALQAAKTFSANVDVFEDKYNRLFLSESPQQVRAERLWARGLTGKGQWVAVLDSGIDTSHPFFKGKKILEACFSPKCPNGKTSMIGKGAAKPVNPHGTHVAGIALGRGKNFTGVAPDANLIAVNVFDEEGRANDGSILAAFDYLVGLKVEKKLAIASINLSLGHGKFSRPCGNSVFEFARKITDRFNMVVVAASGNEHAKNAIASPSFTPGIVSVGAVSKRGEVAKFSNSADFLSLLAPGVGIVSSVPPSLAKGKAFVPLSGTSMAAPHVAGAFALLRQADRDTSVAELVTLLTNSGRLVSDPENEVKKPLIQLDKIEVGVSKSKNFSISKTTNENGMTSITE